MPTPPTAFEVIQPVLQAQPLFWVTSLKRIGVLLGESSSCLGPPVEEGGGQVWAWLEELAAFLDGSLQGLAGAKAEEAERGERGQ